MKSANEKLILTCDINDVLNYAMINIGTDIVRDIHIKNISEGDFDHLRLRISSNSEMIKTYEVGVDLIRAGEEKILKNLKVQINADDLASLTERIICCMKVELYQQECLIVSESADITVLAFDQWPGLQYSPELLTTFVMPNHPGISNLIQLASQYLEKWTENPSLAGYQYDDPNRVKNMAAAAYAAIQQRNITYAEPPSNFEEFGQRIRLVDAILEQHLGTCMDMTLLYAACLEAMGLNPLIVMMKGHVFAGVWLIDESFPDMIMDDPSQMEKRMSRGIHEMTVVECTAMCAGKSTNFDAAVLSAEKKITDYENFAFVIDIRRARSLGIRPLPVRITKNGVFEVCHEDRSERDVTRASGSFVEIYDLSKTDQKEKTTKIVQWERKLLDLSLRNMLINMRLTKSVIPLLSSDVGLLEDALSDGEEFRVMAKPAEMEIGGTQRVSFETLGQSGDFTDYITLEGQKKRLHSIYTAKELEGCLTKLYRAAKTSLEENGASTLYLALGLLRWYERKKSASARYAPVVLLPIEIIRKSAGRGYSMRMRDEDAQINITLLEYMKQNFDIHIAGLNPPPLDEHGLDIPKVFAIIRHAVMYMEGWDVIETGIIANFSFSQFAMWNDVHSNREFLENHKIVQSLIKGELAWDCSIPDDIESEDAYLPITVDSSQLRAINMAAGGFSFVLHGPPGTGKSQTITAMIANALTKGQTVLFVAEKRAALEVVQKRLAALGIQNFCLELHSNKATKKSVLDQLSRGLEIGVLESGTNYDEKIQDVAEMRAGLDAYVQALHVRRPFGKSLRQLVDLYETIPELNQSVSFDHAYASALTEKDLDQHVYRLERLIAAGRGVGHPHDHPLKSIHKTEYSQKLKFELESILSGYTNALENMRKTANSFTEMVGMRPPETKKEWEQVYNCCRAVMAAEKIPGFLRQSENLNREFDRAEIYVQQRQTIEVKKAKLLAKWNENFLRMDMNSYKEKYEAANKKFIGRGKALQALQSEIHSFALFVPEIDQIPVYLSEITFFQKDAAELDHAGTALGLEWKNILQSCLTIEEFQNYKDLIKQQMEIYKRFSDQINSVESTGKSDMLFQTAKNLMNAYHDIQKRETEARELLEITFDTEDEDWIEGRQKLCINILENASSIKDWIIYRQFEAECRDIGLGVICDAYEEGLDHDNVLNVYLRSIYRTIILTVIEEEPVLNGFTGIGFNEKINQFKKIDQDFMNLTREEMYAKLTQQLPSSYESPEISREMNILRKAIKSNGRGLSVRTLFEQITSILPRLCPCMLMSPISAAQYLKAENNLFDLVIFDEASQMPTCKAVGALARGKNAVIAGDPNQMPPTSFFAGNVVDEDNLDIEDLDSILDDCLALGMPSAYLKWHYRSRHESLIAFSNHEFYENSMLTFPSVNDREKKVSFKKVNGYFDRKKGRINEGEARAIVEEIKRRYKDPIRQTQTIGVVTFNISQQTLIEDLLQEEYQRDFAFDKWANSGSEDLFVKNLENVQGDERDVILFSITYGPDAESKLLLNFGPLNKEGGWKRLNVAVSRARIEMMVFSIMTPDMIDLKRTKSKGVEALKDFLAYAQSGNLQNTYTESKELNEQGILAFICNVLEENGYKYQTSVGHSRFKIDIAVINPFNEEEYLLGILLDGESYRQSPNTKDREISQIEVLNGLGWELHRIWTMDWWDNREREIDKLLQHLEERKSTAGQAVFPETMKADNITESEIPMENEDQEEPFESENKKSEIKESPIKIITGSDHFEDFLTILEDPEVKLSQYKSLFFENRKREEDEKYRVTDYRSARVKVEALPTSEYVNPLNLRNITQKMQAILDAEAPISQNQLIKKTLRSFSIYRSSSQTLAATEKALDQIEAWKDIQHGICFYWSKNMNPDMFRIYRKDVELPDKRSADEICQQEVKNAVCVTLLTKKYYLNLHKDQLIKETIRTMGYSRSGSALTAAVERGLLYGLKVGEIKQFANGMFYVD